VPSWLNMAQAGVGRAGADARSHRGKAYRRDARVEGRGAASLELGRKSEEVAHFAASGALEAMVCNAVQTMTNDSVTLVVRKQSGVLHEQCPCVDDRGGLPLP
jgi:hypothetical protein